jgi:chloramphenicol 3-O-phosphotransferase
MAKTQAVGVHAGVGYDVEVDTTRCSALECARRIAASVAS